MLEYVTDLNLSTLKSLKKEIKEVEKALDAIISLVEDADDYSYKTKTCEGLSKLYINNFVYCYNKLYTKLAKINLLKGR